jgi:hypothetical protein
MSGALHHSRSVISIASIISVVSSEPHEYYRRHVIIGIDNSQVGAAECVAYAADVSSNSAKSRCCVPLVHCNAHVSYAVTICLDDDNCMPLVRAVLK